MVRTSGFQPGNIGSTPVGDIKRFNMERYEMSINILDKEYVDSLIVSLVRQGYAVYYNEDENAVCFTVGEDELIKIKKV